MAEALWPREGLTTPREAVAAREAASPRRLSIAMPIPAHVGVVLGLATAGYAVTLAGVTALQSGADAAVAAARSPIGAAIDATAAGHDRLDAALGAAGQDYDAAAARYQAAADQLTAVEAQIDALGDEGRPRVRPQPVVADRTHEPHRRAQARGGGGLVAALAAVMPGEGRPRHGLARRRQASDGRDEIDVDRADDDDASAHRASLNR